MSVPLRADLVHLGAPVPPRNSRWAAAPCRPLKPGLCRKPGTDPLSKFAVQGVERPAFGLTGYLSSIVVGARQAEVTLDPGGGELQGTSGFRQETSRGVKAGPLMGPGRRVRVPAPEGTQGLRPNRDASVQAAGVVRLAGGEYAGSWLLPATDALTDERDPLRSADAR
jgi:hypothetical protein